MEADGVATCHNPINSSKENKNSWLSSDLSEKPRLKGGAAIHTTVEGANRVDIPATMDITVSALQNLPGQPRTHLDLGQLSSLVVRIQLHHPQIFRVSKPSWTR